MPAQGSSQVRNATELVDVHHERDELDRERPADVLIGNQEGGVSNRGTALLGKRDA